MRNKAFTLIELLAVIVILAIIALIAIPIILGIIKDAKTESNKRSIEGYADAVANAIAKHQIKNPNEEVSGTFTSTNGGKTLTGNIILTVEYDGNIVCDIIEVYEDGKFYLGDCKVNGDKVEYAYGKREETLAQYITNLYKNSTTKTNSLEVDGITYILDTTNGLMDDRLGGIVESGGNIRYYGATPNNYIDIGDKDASGNVILWRIIGVFKDIDVTDKNGNIIKKEDLVKIIRVDSIGNMAWDNGYKNKWSSSSLNTYLNTGIYYQSLNSNVTLKIENIKWNIGGFYGWEGGYVNDLYIDERSTKKAPSTWSGKVGLMYLSDYGYGADLGQCNKELFDYDTTTLCKVTDWLLDSSTSQWTLTPNFHYSDVAFHVTPDSYVASDRVYRADHGVRTVIYLKSDISIVGTGTTSEGINYYIVG